ncbi:hypothetical protein BYT27DRAFT_7173121 [Phlegmacium glaucopus]|nr:hypothetical protein BYT27DRAFT_7173121 [Phlegmacium glaucopus]
MQTQGQLESLLLIFLLLHSLLIVQSHYLPMDCHQYPSQTNVSSSLATNAIPHGDTSSNTIGKSKVPRKTAKRIRGEIACAECRRLKIRCDKTVPCSTCVKRGCGVLCPNGTIPPGEGSRFVMAATDHLHHKLRRLEMRMGYLEDALAIIHSSESDRPHPLFGLPDDAEEEEGHLFKAVSEEPLPPTNALGTLCPDAQGGSHPYRPSGGSETLSMSTDRGITPRRPTGPLFQELDPSYLPPEINHCYQIFPLSPPNDITPSVQPVIESFLPSIDRAITLCDTCYEHLSWMFQIVSRDKLVNELIPIVYKQTSIAYGPHDLAFLLVVFAIGSLVDLNLPPYNLEAQHYYRLSRATLALQPVLGAHSIVTIKVLHLMSAYNSMSEEGSDPEQSSVLLDLAGQVALRIGFHIDPSVWGFEGREAYDRRFYFWNLMSGVLWQSLVTRRPPSLLMSYIDCRIPTAEDESIFLDKDAPYSSGFSGFRASAECLVPLARALLSVKPPSYSIIMDLDQKIRELSLPNSDTIQSHEDQRAISMRIFAQSHHQELMLLFLHRAYFAEAMTENPDNPMNSPYSQSITAAYSSACVVLQDSKTQFMRKPLLCARVWRIWPFTFSAAMIVGTAAIRGVHLNLQPPPLEEFEAILKLFSDASETSSRAARALPVLQVMLQKAYQAHKYYQEHGTPLPAHIHEDDDLRFLRGRSSVMFKADEPLIPVFPSLMRSRAAEGSHMGMEPPSTFPTKPIKPTMPASNYPVPPCLDSEPRHARAPLPSAFGTLQYQTFTDFSKGSFHHSTGADHATDKMLSSPSGGVGRFPETDNVDDNQSQTMRWQGHHPWIIDC